MSQRPTITIPDAGILAAPRTRRDILKLLAVGGTLMFLPAALSGCSDDNSVTPPSEPQPNSGSPLAIDFAKGDIAILQFAYALEQLEAEFYQRCVAAPGLIDAADRTICTHISGHETVHVTALQSLIRVKGATPIAKPAFDFTAKGNLPGFNFGAGQYETFKVLAMAFEDTGVRA